MATARNVQLSTSDTGVFSVGVREDSARAASEVLQDDLEKHHVFFNDIGFHNHIVHHVLTIYALGGSPDEIKAAYERDKRYQRSVLPTDDGVVQAFQDKAQFRQHLGKEKHYPNYLAFFQQEIDKRGVGDVLNEYLFSGTENAENMLSRLFGGLLHPLIHLGFGIEFDQPAIIAEGLAQTAVHDNWMGQSYLLPVEKAAGGIGKHGKKTLLQILNEARADKKLAESAKWEDGNKMRDGVLKRAPDEMIKFAAEFSVSAEQVDEKLAEIISTVAYFTSAAQRPPKQVKLDFFLMHCVTASIFFSKIVALPYLDTRTKLRLLEWKGRADLMLYVSQGAPELLLDEVTTYEVSKDWNTIFRLSTAQPRDDGHLSKLVRALAHGEKACQSFEAQAKELGIMVTGDMWQKIGSMAIDSTREDPMWVRSTGFEQAWADFHDRSRM
ncbi:questin oxidase family protein [Aspergillus clavatus NRRL 1]|uniref:HypA protein, putative n=1 Tax=Aspergillus clavatus (strain ATCC 1007 / CBS 513.65 / DSM 816 / NCTC 3887 / NRRL 1 / QM 1276 / 107) TaxID=344612 RepID=A1C505_ASPCL|nr:HypA protein, putative [Aspergillus clavatus NRRL 1]EAW14773.1 HypA protein, putative [Aspergillus clavatus NRRL 1]